jgi:phosphotransferase system HPr (HPr) family protein
MQTTATRNVVVRNQQGLHIRAATTIAKTVRQFESKVELVRNQQRVEGTDVWQILALGVDPGTQLVLEATGPDAHEALAALVRLFSENFGEES